MTAVMAELHRKPSEVFINSLLIRWNSEKVKAATASPLISAASTTKVL
jgi:hypothetical protein